MTATVRYSFTESVPFEEVEGTLLIALIGVEALHGEAVARLDAGHLIDRPGRACLLDAATPAGKDLNSIFLALIRREVGPSAYTVERAAPAAAA